VTTALYVDGGEPRGFSEIMQDITEKKEAEKLLEDTGNRLRTLVEHVPAITYTGGSMATMPWITSVLRSKACSVTHPGR